VSALVLAPLGLALLAAIWCGIQRKWLATMARPATEDALARGGCGGDACATGACSAPAPTSADDAPTTWESCSERASNRTAPPREVTPT
jgi:hypothetical protein